MAAPKNSLGRGGGNSGLVIKREQSHLLSDTNGPCSQILDQPEKKNLLRLKRSSLFRPHRRADEKKVVRRHLVERRFRRGVIRLGRIRRFFRRAAVDGIYRV